MQIAGLLQQIVLLLWSGGDMPEPSIISFDMELIKNLLFLLANVIILVFILAKVLYKPVREFMDKRQAGIQSDLDAATQARQEAEALKAECEAQLRQIEKEREQILENARKKAMDRSEHIIKEAREEAEAVQKHAIAEMREERATIQAEIRRQLIELSVMVAERFVSHTIDEETQDKFINEAIANWEEKLWLD